MKIKHFDNRFVRELPGDLVRDNFPRQVQHACWSQASPTPVSKPQLLAFASDLAQLLEISQSEIVSDEFVAAFSGNNLLPGMTSYAACYGGHQFGQWVGQLGDGRAINLGELINSKGERWELQLKGAGPTPYSRSADGRAVLRSSIREFLCSEAMYHLGVPTTRALCLIGTGDFVVRDMFYDGNPYPEPGAIVCRVAPSFIRFGNFEILAARKDFELLKQLVDFTRGPLDSAAWFKTICERTAELIVHWMRVGFVHGVMNTDNMSILGLTLDYGPYGWIDNYDPNWTPNTTDEAMHRYAFGKQASVAQWNLACLANALAPVMNIEDLQAGLEQFHETYVRAHQKMTDAKFGLANSWSLAQEAYALMETSEVDMTSFFRMLAEIDMNAPNFNVLADVFYSDRLCEQYKPQWTDWLKQYCLCLVHSGVSNESRKQSMNAANPRYVLRNYLAQEAIDLAEAGDLSLVHMLQEVMCDPYTEKEEYKRFAQKRPDWARHKAGCSMLSCSS